MTVLHKNNFTERREKPVSQANKYKSVSIYPGENGCSAARKFGNRRLLVAEAPALPLRNCSAETCSCRYFTYGDRRSCLINRRLNGKKVSRVASLFRRSNRRKGVDRRKVKVDFLRFGLLKPGRLLIE